MQLLMTASGTCMVAFYADGGSGLPVWVAPCLYLLHLVGICQIGVWKSLMLLVDSCGPVCRVCHTAFCLLLLALYPLLSFLLKLMLALHRITLWLCFQLFCLLQLLLLPLNHAQNELLLHL